MQTKIIRLNQKNTNEFNIMIKEAAEVLRKGGLVAFPTETVYGLGGNAFDRTAASKIYEAKGRPSDNPLIVHISAWHEIMPLVKNIPDTAKKLADKFWPGPLTLVLEKSKDIPCETTGGLETVAVRIPNHIVALALIQMAGIPVAAPSANTSGRPSPTLAKHVVEDLSGKIDRILDSGAVGIGLESTIVDLTDAVPIILRPGFITKTMLEEVLGEVRLDNSLPEGQEYAGVIPKAPGMKYKHYAPKGNLIIFEGEREAVIREINKRTVKQLPEEVGIITTDEGKDRYIIGRVQSVGKRIDEEMIARELYKVLREFDEEGIKYIYAESFCSEGLGQAIMNRLLKAANYQVVQVK